MTQPKLLLHICCAPCSPHVVDLLKKDYEVTAYFYDPNIHPEEEYRFRLEEMRRFCGAIGLPFMEAEYDPDRWFQAMKGREHDPEKGARCSFCIRLRLERAVFFAKEKGFAVFATVLSVSPHKDAKVINDIGRELAKDHGVAFHEADFKKQEGFKLSVEKGKALGLKRQDYCGCVYSKKQRNISRCENSPTARNS